jgi:HlyD family secretion protein
LWIGQPTLLRFTAFNQRTTPEINGTLDRISADISIEPKTGQSYYTVRIALSAAEIARLGSVKIVPGMPVESMIKTGDRKVISYLVKPLHDQIARAFREK